VRANAWVSPVVATLLLPSYQNPQQPPQVFRSGADAVFVDVAVRDRNRQVSNLTAADFEVRDNGVRQDIVNISTEPAPLDLVVLVDMSWSLDDWRVASRGAVTRAASDIQTMRRAGDRVRLVRFANSIREVASVPELGAPSSPESSGTALLDAIAVALMEPIELGRRRVVLVLTDGIDTASSLGYPLLTEILDRSEGAVFVLGVSRHRAFEMFGPVSLKPRRSTQDEYFEAFTRALRNVADRTGGRFYDLRPWDDLDSRIEAIIGQVRTSYVLRYIPSQMETGWHTIQVSVRGK
jgi:Ca-activated chloride channel family protein